jgi:hypothetical protein
MEQLLTNNKCFCVVIGLYDVERIAPFSTTTNAIYRYSIELNYNL